MTPPISSELIRAHAELDEAEVIRLRTLTDSERCIAQVGVRGGRDHSSKPPRGGIADPVPAPWPESTWAFLKECGPVCESRPSADAASEVKQLATLLETLNQG